MTTPLPPFNLQVPIVDMDGRPTPEFARWITQSLYKRVGGPTELSNTELADQANDVTTQLAAITAEVTALDGEVQNLEATAITKDALGGDASIQNLEHFSLANQAHQFGYTVLWLTASASGARCNPLFRVDEVTYSRTGGVIQFQCHDFANCDEGRWIKLASAKYPRLMCHARVLSVVPGADGLMLIRAQEMYVTTPRDDVVEGSIKSDTTMICHDLQGHTNCHNQIIKANSMLEGSLDVLNFGIGGSNTTTWQDPELRAYIEAVPYADFIVYDGGMGNNLTDTQTSTADIFVSFEDGLTWAETRARKTFVLLSEGARLGGDTPIANPQLTVDFTSLHVLNHYLRQFIATRHKAVEVIDGEMRFMRSAMYGSADTDDITRGQPPAEFFGADGIHRTPTGSDETAIEVFEAFAPSVKQYLPLAYNRCDFIGANPTPDLAGLTNPNGLYPTVGAVPTAAVTVGGLIFIGTGFEGTTCDGSGFTGNMSGSLAVVPGRRGNMEERLTLIDPDGGETFNRTWRGTAANPILTAVNAMQGVDLDLVGDFGFWGFLPDSLVRIEAGLYGVADGSEYGLALWYTDAGSNNMFGAQRAWVRGTNGPHRVSRIRIPRRTYTDAYVRWTFVATPLAGYHLGKFYARFGEVQLRRRDLLAPAAAGAFA